MMMKFNVKGNFSGFPIYSKLMESIERMLSLSVKHIHRHIELAAKVSTTVDSH